MRAIRIAAFGEPEVMRIEEVPDPRPGPGQVVVRVRAAGVNPVETYVRSGSYASLPELPYTPGSDSGGEVEAVGAGVSLKAGERVFTSGSITGTYAEKALCEAWQVHPLPASLGFEQGAALGVPYATAWRALFQRARAMAGERVLIHGASGGVGIATTQMARAAGMLVVGTAGSEEGRGLVAARGAHHVVDHSHPGHLEQAMKEAGGPFDVIVEMLANVNLGKDLPALARGGRVVVVGSRGTVEINPRDLMSREAAVMGMVLPNACPAERESLWAGIGAGLESGTLRPEVGRTLPLAEAPRAHLEILSSKAVGKLVLLT
ncbi:MAG: NADPH:quinone reductase [Deltaproteobacteria bacterium]|nr:NADPH:quinone reductase [Deltaproteobacteria bacterium]